MTVEIREHIPEAGFFPGQIVVDHPNAHKWCASGKASPVGYVPEEAEINPPEAAVRKRRKR